MAFCLQADNDLLGKEDLGVGYALLAWYLSCSLMTESLDTTRVYLEAGAYVPWGQAADAVHTMNGPCWRCTIIKPLAFCVLVGS